MSFLRDLARVALIVCCCACVAPFVASMDARAASFAGVPASAVELSKTTETVADYSVLVSAAEKVGRELRYDDAVQVSGLRTRTLWQLPSGARLDSVFNEASQALTGDVLFECRGRDCGRSTAWATLVYSQALVFGQDRYQRYRVVQTSANQIAALYVVQRGNRRVHLLLETLDSAQAISRSAASSVRAELASAGYSRLNVVPGESHGFGDEVAEGAGFSQSDIAQLRGVGRELSGLQAGTVYVVCHLYGAGETEYLLARSAACASAAQTQISAGYAAAQSELPVLEQANRARPPETAIEAFGAGPLLPRLTLESSAVNRLELVVPSQLRRP